MFYIGNFMQLTNQQAKSEAERRFGEFTLIVEAGSQEEAAEKFQASIEAYRRNSQLFEGTCQVFLIQLIEFMHFSTTATMLNYKSYVGDPILPFIGCTVPSGEGDSCRIYEWDENKLAIDGLSGKLFAEFSN